MCLLCICGLCSNVKQKLHKWEPSVTFKSRLLWRSYCQQSKSYFLVEMNVTGDCFAKCIFTTKKFTFSSPLVLLEKLHTYWPRVDVVHGPGNQFHVISMMNTILVKMNRRPTGLRVTLMVQRCTVWFHPCSHWMQEKPMFVGGADNPVESTGPLLARRCDIIGVCKAIVTEKTASPLTESL